MASRIRTVLLKSNGPTVEEARARLKTEIDRAKTAGIMVLKVIHGYGSSGVGGALRSAVQASLRKRRKEGIIRAFVAGEQWEVFDDVSSQILQVCPEMARDQDLNRGNEGISIVLL